MFDSTLAPYKAISILSLYAEGDNSKRHSVLNIPLISILSLYAEGDLFFEKVM